MYLFSPGNVVEFHFTSVREYHGKLAGHQLCRPPETHGCRSRVSPRVSGASAKAGHGGSPHVKTCAISDLQVVVGNCQMCVVELTMTLGWCVLYSHPSQWVMVGGVHVLCKDCRSQKHQPGKSTGHGNGVPVCGMTLAVWYATPGLGSESKPGHAPAKSETHVEVS
jgi:hypothetical protein